MTAIGNSAACSDALARVRFPKEKQTSSGIAPTAVHDPKPIRRCRIFSRQYDARDMGQRSVMKLYSHYRSSASYRVRIALNLKVLTYEHVTLDLDKSHADQHRPEYQRVNPQSVVPSLELDNGTILMQSMAIIEYLEEAWPEPRLLPRRIEDRALVRALSQIVCTDMHPLHTTRLINYLGEGLSLQQISIDRWITHWSTIGLKTIERLVGDDGYCVGGAITMADVFLVPEVYAARRFKVDLEPFERIRRVEERCNGIEAFQLAHPLRQPDAAP
jgi:maleylacetoacetate isomerase